MDAVNIWPDGSAVAYPVHPRKEGKRERTEKEQDKKASNRFKKLRCAINLIARGKRDSIFITVTCGGVENSLGKLSLLLNLMRNAYGLTNYVWVRELTQSGLEHFHIAAQFKEGKHHKLFWQGSRKAIQLSDAWAKILGVKSFSNSIRFGWAYKRTEGSKYPRATKWYIDEGSARYMAKYLSKSKLKHGRKVQLSQKLAEVCQPARFVKGDPNQYAHKKSSVYFCANAEKFIPELIPPTHINKAYLLLYDWWLCTNDKNFCYAGRIREPDRFKFFTDYLRSNN